MHKNIHDAYLNCKQKCCAQILTMHDLWQLNLKWGFPFPCIITNARPLLVCLIAEVRVGMITENNVDLHHGKNRGKPFL